MPAIYTAAQKSEAAFPLKRYLLLAANNIIKFSVQLIVIYLCAHKLSLKDYALYQTVWLYVNVLSVIALFGLPNLLLAYPTGNIIFWLRKNKLAFVVFFIGLNLLPLLYLFFIESNFSWQARALLVLLVIIQNVSVIIEARAVKLELEKRVVRANLPYAILFLATHILLLYYGYSLPLLLVILVILQIIKTLYLSSSIEAPVTVLQPLNLGRQWLYLGMGEVLGIIYKWLDKWLILYFISLSEFAIYFNGSYEIPIFLVLISAVGNVMIVELSKHELQPVKVRSLYTNTSLLLAAIVFPAFSFLFFYHEFFFILFFGEQYRAAIPIFLITIFVLPLRITNFTAFLQALRRNDVVFKGIVLDLGSAILLMVLLYPFWGTKGIAAAFVMSTYLQAAFYLWQTVRVTGLPLTTFLPFTKLAATLMICITATGLSYYLFKTYFLAYLLLVGVLVSLLLSVFFIAFQLRWRRRIL